MPQHIIVYSHGFGVRKDDRGLFTDIAASLRGATHAMFDYNHIDKTTDNLTVVPLDEQVATLKSEIEKAQSNNPGATIDLICHSQGCVVAALLAPQTIRKAIFIGPPAELSVESMVQIFKNRPGAHIDLQGTSHLTRADFTATDVPASYWKSIEGVDPIALYNAVSITVPLTIINAAKDEILGSQDFSGLSPRIHITTIDAGHNFEADSRQKLLATVSKELL